MNHRNLLAFMLMSAVPLALAACTPPPANDQGGTPPASAGSAPEPASKIGNAIRNGMAKAKQEMATRDVDIDSVHVGGQAHPDIGRPKAVITPQGELVIAGKAVAVTPAQRSQLLGYRQQIIAIAQAGMDIGAQGADLGMNAAKEAMIGAFTGKSDKEIEAGIKPQTDRIEAAALALCQRMPGLMASQQQLAATLPAFKPYATMTQKDVDDCGKSRDKNGRKGIAVFSD